MTSTLCYGVQWDATMQFMDNKYLSGECDENSYVRNSMGKSQDRDAIINTGSVDAYSEKIYMIWQEMCMNGQWRLLVI